MNDVRDLQEDRDLQDDVLVSIRQGAIDHVRLRQLHPHRARLLAGIAVKAGAMSRRDYDDLNWEINNCGGLPLRSWAKVQTSVQRNRTAD